MDEIPPHHGPELGPALRAAGLVGAWNFAFGLFFLIGSGFGALCCAVPAGAPTVSVIWDSARPRAHGVSNDLSGPAVMLVLALLGCAPNVLLHLLHGDVLARAVRPQDQSR